MRCRPARFEAENCVGKGIALPTDASYPTRLVRQREKLYAGIQNVLLPFLSRESRLRPGAPGPRPEAWAKARGPGPEPRALGPRPRGPGLEPRVRGPGARARAQGPGSPLF